MSRDCTVDLAGADVVVVDDILDTGRTDAESGGALAGPGAAAYRNCALLDSRRGGCVFGGLHRG